MRMIFVKLGLIPKILGKTKGFYTVGRCTANISENSKQADSERLSGQRREVQNHPSLLDQLST